MGGAHRWKYLGRSAAMVPRWKANLFRIHAGRVSVHLGAAPERGQPAFRRGIPGGSPALSAMWAHSPALRQHGPVPRTRSDSAQPGRSEGEHLECESGVTGEGEFGRIAFDPPDCCLENYCCGTYRRRIAGIASKLTSRSP